MLEDPGFTDFLSAWHKVHQTEVKQGSGTIVTTCTSDVSTCTGDSSVPSTCAGSTGVVSTCTGSRTGASGAASRAACGSGDAADAGGVGDGNEGGGVKEGGGVEEGSLARCQGDSWRGGPACSTPGSSGRHGRSSIHARAHAAGMQVAASQPQCAPTCQPPLAQSDGEVGAALQWRAGRPAIVVSSTSWTPDEVRCAACMQAGRQAGRQARAQWPRMCGEGAAGGGDQHCVAGGGGGGVRGVSAHVCLRL